MRTSLALLILFCHLTTNPLAAQEAGRVESNIVFGMHSGLALLMDVYHPDPRNGAGILLVHGSGWHSDTAFSAEQLKAGYPYMNDLRDALVQAGYTVFVLNHRAAPTFRYPDAVNDVKRASQFVRFRAAEFDIDPERMGAFGHSSGGHLVALLGVLDDHSGEYSGDDVDRTPFKVTAVASIAGPMDLNIQRHETNNASAPSLVAFMGERPTFDEERLIGKYREASPITHVTSDDASFLIIHGTSDPVVPHSVATAMHAALRAAGVPSTLLEPDGGHSPDVNPRILVDWFDAKLGSN